MKQFHLQNYPLSASTLSRMSDRAEALRQKIRKSGRSVREIATEAGVSPLKLWRWVTGKTKVFDMRNADKVERVLTGQITP